MNELSGPLLGDLPKLRHFAASPAFTYRLSHPSQQNTANASPALQGQAFGLGIGEYQQPLPPRLHRIGDRRDPCNVVRDREFAASDAGEDP